MVVPEHTYTIVPRPKPLYLSCDATVPPGRACLPASPDHANCAPPHRCLCVRESRREAAVADSSSGFQELLLLLLNFVSSVFILYLKSRHNYLFC